MWTVFLSILILTFRFHYRISVRLFFLSIFKPTCHRSLQLCLWFIKLAGGGREEEGTKKVHNNNDASECFCTAKGLTPPRTRTRTRSARAPSTCSDCLSQDEEVVQQFWPIKGACCPHGLGAHAHSPQHLSKQTQTSQFFKIFSVSIPKFLWLFVSIHIRRKT